MNDISAIQTALVPAAPGSAAESNLKGSDPAKIRDAAQQFEGLLLAQILGSVSEGGGGWLGSSEDQAGAAATGFAVQQLAGEIAHRGGLGLANLISAGLERSGQAPSPKLSAYTQENARRQDSLQRSSRRSHGAELGGHSEGQDWPLA